MVDRIHGVRLKVERAKKHIADLERELHAFFDRNPYKIGEMLRPEISHYRLYIESIEPMPDIFALLLGDAIHNLRTALDHLAWQLVQAGGGTPDKDTYFPIYIDPNGSRKYTSAIGKGEMNKMPLGAQKALEAMQPYKTGDNTLWQIHQLDIVDKHHLVVPVYSVPSAWGLKNPRVWFADIGRKTAVKAGDELFNIPVDTYEKAGRNFDIGFHIAFAEPQSVEGVSVLETLKGMAVFVENILGTFEPFLV